MGDWHGFERRRRDVSTIGFCLQKECGCVYETYSALKAYRISRGEREQRYFHGTIVHVERV